MSKKRSFAYNYQGCGRYFLKYTFKSISTSLKSN